MRSDEPGVRSSGFSTTVQPAASAGASFIAPSSMGKLNGVIIPATPTGSRSVYVWYCWPGVYGQEMVMVWPRTLVARPAKK